MNKQDFDKAVDDLWRTSGRNGIKVFLLAYKELIAKADAARMPTADAAQFLYLSGGMSQEGLHAYRGGFIRNTACAGGFGYTITLADMIEAGYIAPGYVEGYGVGQVFASTPSAFTVKAPAFPDREATADAALYLYMNFATSEAWLRNAPAKTIRLDAEDVRKAMDARKVKVLVTVHLLGNEESGDYIHLKFFKGAKLVGKTMIKGYCASPYARTVELSEDYDSCRQESSISAVFSVKRVTA
jgi:hypothetical protein